MRIDWKRLRIAAAKSAAVIAAAISIIAVGVFAVQTLGIYAIPLIVAIVLFIGFTWVYY